ncbi:MAG TPA: hypothetical protein V6C57_29120 [Coleofasciculaceae cyanobacterium]
MHQITLIQKTLQPHLGWHGARVKFVALFRVKTVNLTELASGFIWSSQTGLELQIPATVLWGV